MKNIKILMSLVLICLLSCVQETHEKTVIIKVDMNGVKNAETVMVKGSFTDNPWSEALPLKDLNNDGIYEITLNRKTAFNSISFKFTLGENRYELIGKDNRSIQFEYQPETIIYETVFNNPDAKITKQ